MHFVCNYHVSFPGLGIENISISRIAFEFNLFGHQMTVYWYGLIFTIAMVLCIVLAMTHAKKYDFTGDDILDYFLWMIPLILIGSRIYFVAFEWSQFKGDWAAIIDLRRGGLAFYGGVIGGIIAVVMVARIKRVKLHRVLDFFAVYLPLGQGIGRWGNFFNQEAFGTNTSLPWGMISEGTAEGLAMLNPNPASPLPGLNPALPVHPTFLYEFIANMLIFVILLVIRKRSKRPYMTVMTYFFLYGIVRFFVEGVRTDSLMFFLGGYELRISQVVSAVMVIGSIIVFVILHIKGKKRDQMLAGLAATPADIIEIPLADTSEIDD
ncbi:MAG: prolipoprotein diacylglyceryl transferase [Clostridiaceae bacterium]|jgi:phosphatidylglycerol:prolipoprotein diacylglycerol transferase|nr:prolipoprotein diacylglyceryl transferase [Clostridiaceae bacterium]